MEGTVMDMMERYNELYDTMSVSRDAKKMKVFGNAERMAFAYMVKRDPSFAEKWLEKLEAVDWNNYLSEDEATEILEGVMSQDGRKGPTWNRSQVAGAVRDAGGEMECMPYYNEQALYVMMNVIASDHLNTLREYVPEQDIPKVVYRLSVEKLKDRDRPEFIRAYFGLE